MSLLTSLQDVIEICLIHVSVLFVCFFPLTIYEMCRNYATKFVPGN